jgi:glycosyltransferase involved in cell wall biosynthesis
MKVLFLISDGFGIGGTIRTTFNLAEALARRGHDVEVLSTFRRRDVPELPLDPSVRLMSLLEVRPDHPDYDATDPLRGRPTVVYPRDDFRAADYDLLAEDRAARYLRRSDADVVIATRPGLIAWVAQFAPERMIRIGQEHLTRSMHSKGLRTAMVPHYGRLDAFVTVSARDAEDYRGHLKLRRTRLLFIPNSVPAPRIPVSDGRHHIVVAAGRLVGNKRYDVLIRAFAAVVRKHPDWQLRVYGGGEKRAMLRRLILELGLHNHVLMMGGFTPIEPEWAKGAIAAVPSDKEPFGMTLVEAMRCGLPVVSTDAPYGPAEILEDGVDGQLTPVGDHEAMAQALLDIIGNPVRRAEMAAAAVRNSVRYDPGPVAERYEQLFAELAADKARHQKPRRQRLAARLKTVLRDRWRAVPVLGPAGHSSRTVADCTVTTSGELLLWMPPGTVPAKATLAWQRVDTATPKTVAVAALTRGGDGVSATVGADDLPPGSWELQIVDGKRRVPVAAGMRDTRALLDAEEAPDGGIHVRMPYRGAKGSLQVRVWRRPVHPEIGEVSVHGAEIRFDGRLLGAKFGSSEPHLDLRCRVAGGPVVHAPVRAVDDTTFRVALPARLLTAHRTDAAEDLWDIWLRYDDDAAPVRLGRFLDDVVDKRGAYIYPDAVLHDSDRGDMRAQPYYTVHNEFSVRVANLPT